jgi:hypothetical protein
VRRCPFCRAGVHRRFPRCVAVRVRLELRRRRGLRRSAGRRCEEGGRAGELVRPEPPARSPATLSTGASSRSRRRSLYLSRSSPAVGLFLPALSVASGAGRCCGGRRPRSRRRMGRRRGDFFAGECGGEASCGWEEMGSGLFLMRGVHHTAQMLTYWAKF